MKKPCLALVGRPNVGKSALFNRICGKRISIVDEKEGVTRDRVYGEAELFGDRFTLIDTGGIAKKGSFSEEINVQVVMAMEEADVIIMVVDAKIGITKEDEYVAKLLLRTQKPLVLAVNKVDQREQEFLIHPFHALGISKISGISATQGLQIPEMLELAFENISFSEEETEKNRSVKIVILGRPNVGKSTLFNTLFQSKRAIVSDVPGTTRDSIDVQLEVSGNQYTLIDTAGLRRKKKENDVIEKFSTVRTEEALKKSDIALLMLDSQEGLNAQEKRFASMIEKEGKSCILLFNKWDCVKGFRMEHCLKDIQNQNHFLKHCPTLFVSAKTGRNTEKIFPQIDLVYEQRKLRVTTGQLNQFLKDCMQKYSPPMITGKRLRIYYMTQAECNPPKFMCFVNRTDLFVDSYKKYLINSLRKTFGFIGAPLELRIRGKQSSRCEKKEPIEITL